MPRPALAITCLLLLIASTAAQIKVSVQLVNVVATVTDNRGRYITGLKASDFTLAEDGTRQEIVHFGFSNDLPVSVGIVLDVSQSMERKISTATKAVDRFLRTIHEDDEIFLMTFANSVRVPQNFTSDRNKLADALEGIRLEYGTALYDAVVAGAEKVRKGKHSKKALLLISDGVDTESQHDENSARLAVRESEILVYALGISPDSVPRGPMTERNPQPGRPGGGIGGTIPVPGGGRQPSPLPGGISLPFPIPLPGPGRRQFPPRNTGNGSLDAVDMGVLDDFARDSGGKAWLITVDGRRSQIQDVLDEIADELRSQYTVGYYPNHDLKDGKWHRIELELKNADYNIRYKQDYLGK